MKAKQLFLGMLLVVILIFGLKSISWAQTPTNQVTPPPKSVLNVKTSSLPEASVLEGEILTATMAPKEVSIWHTHASPVFAYTVAGEYAVDFKSGQPSITVPAGKAIMEPINVVVRARNTSSTEPAKLVLFQVRKPGTPFLNPASD